MIICQCLVFKAWPNSSCAGSPTASFGGSLHAVTKIACTALLRFIFVKLLGSANSHTFCPPCLLALCLQIKCMLSSSKFSEHHYFQRYLKADCCTLLLGAAGSGTRSSTQPALPHYHWDHMGCGSGRQHLVHGIYFCHFPVHTFCCSLRFTIVSLGVRLGQLCPRSTENFDMLP